MLDSMLGKFALAKIGYNHVSWIKQYPQTAATFFAYASPASMAKSAADMAKVVVLDIKKHPMYQEAFVKSAAVRTRTNSIQMEWLNAAQEANKYKEDTAYNKAAKVGLKALKLGMWGQNHADLSMTTIGWTAVYTETKANELKAGKSEEKAEYEAIKQADKALNESQPSVSTWNTVEGFMPGSGVWRGLMMFGIPLNRLYNMWGRVPKAIKEKNMRYVLGFIIPQAVVGIALRAAFGYFHEDDDEDKKPIRRAIFTGLVEPLTATLPFGIVSNMATWAAERAIVGDKNMKPASSVFPVIDTMADIVQYLVDPKPSKLITDALEMSGYIWGIPDAELNRFKKAIEEEDIRYGLGMQGWID